ncbi:MAG: NUDIX hydrolase [Candidatus Moranbacteria bacterium]|nr:NUDIX hydrolase [Candidatus Moranbacteria bacterium]
MHRSVAAIIKNEKDEILMLDRKNFPFGWACPAGHVEEGEEPEEAMVREVQEETGLDVTKFKLILHEFLDWNECKRGVKGHDFFVYEITGWTGEIEQNKLESKDLQWKTISEIKNMQLEPAWEYFLTKLKMI